MTLAFPNPSRSFDEARNAVRFVGHDGMSTVPFFVEAAALIRSAVSNRETAALEAICLSAFDASRTSIHKAARAAYAKNHSSSYTLTSADIG